MQSKTIEKTIRDKMNAWLKTITDTDLAKAVKDTLLVSGGSIASMFLNEKVNDFDVYIQDRDVLMRLVGYYTYPFGVIQILDGSLKYNYACEGGAFGVSVRNLKEDQIKLFFKSQAGYRVEKGEEEAPDNYTPKYFSPNAISLSDDIQIVLRFWGTPEKIHETFDYVHATNYYTTKDGLVTNLKAIESLLTKQLKYQGSHYPLTSIIRSKKFLKRGFNIGAEEYLKMIYQVSLLDLNNPDVLEEQLIGVDVAYFAALIAILRGQYEVDPYFKMTMEYLVEIIDRVFERHEDTEELVAASEVKVEDIPF